MSATLHVVRERSLADVPATLRELADAIEQRSKDSGKTTDACVVVWTDADGVQVSYSGSGEAAPNAVFFLQLGIAKMVAAVADGGAL
jgi:hypothetical protein